MNAESTALITTGLDCSWRTGVLRKDEEDREQKALNAFLDDIEEDKEYRANFNLYKNTDYRPSTESEATDDDLHIRMDEVSLSCCHFIANTYLWLPQLLEDISTMELEDDAPGE